MFAAATHAHTDARHPVPTSYRSHFLKSVGVLKKSNISNIPFEKRLQPLQNKAFSDFNKRRYSSDKKAIVLPFYKAIFPFFKTQ